MGANLSNFEVDDEVVIGLNDVEGIYRLRDSRAEWQTGLTECLKGPCKIIQTIGKDAIISGPSGHIYRIDSTLLTKYEKPEEFEPGDMVEMIADEDLMRLLQIGHGEMLEGLKDTLGEVVKVIEKDKNGDYIINFNGTCYTINVRCFFKKEESFDIKRGDRVRLVSSLTDFKSLQYNHGGWTNFMVMLQGQEVEVVEVLNDGDCYVSKYGMEWLINSLCIASVNEKFKAKNKLKKGDVVKISDDIQWTKELQVLQGAWIPQMKSFAGKVAQVVDVLPTGHVRVYMNGYFLSYNRYLLTKVNVNQKNSRVKDVCSSKKADSNARSSINDAESDTSEELKLERCEALFQAIRDGDLTQTRNLTDLVGPNVARETMTPLMVAVEKGHLEIVKFLLENKAEVNRINKTEDTALIIAVKNNEFEIAKALIEAGADVNHQNSAKVSSLMLAAKNRSHNILNLLVEQQQVNLNLQDSGNRTALHYAADNGDVESVETLLDHGADLRLGDDADVTPFHLATFNDDERMLEIFLKRKGPSIVDLQTKDDLAAIHFATINNYIGCLKILIEHHADINIRCGQLKTALHLAVLQRHFNCVKILVENHAELNLRDGRGDTPLLMALKAYKFDDIIDMRNVPHSGTDRLDDIIVYLVSKGARLDIKNSGGQTPMSFCKDDILKDRILNAQSASDPYLIEDEDQVQVELEDERSEEEKIEKMRQLVKEMEDQRMCNICRDRLISVTLGCGHVSCDLCANNSIKCPFCGVSIKQKIRIYE